MSEEITIKISAETLNEESVKTENREIDIKINQNATVNDLIDKIKENKELVNGQKYLMIEFNGKILTNSYSTNLFATLKDFGIKNNFILQVNLLPPGKDSKPKNLQYWVNISDEVNIKIKESHNQEKEISLNKNTKCSELIELIKNEKEITGNNKYFLLTFGGKIITDQNNMEKTLEQLNVKNQSVISIGFSNEPTSDKWIEIPEQSEKTKDHAEKKQRYIDIQQARSKNIGAC